MTDEVQKLIDKYYRSSMTDVDYYDCLDKYTGNGGNPDDFPSKGELDAKKDSYDSVHEFSDYDSIEENRMIRNKRFNESIDAKDFEDKYINSLSPEMRTAMFAAIEDYRCKDISDNYAYKESRDKYIQLGGNREDFPSKDQLDSYVMYVDLDTNYSEEAFEKEHQVESRHFARARMREDYIPSDDQSFSEKYGDKSLISEDDEDTEMIDPMIKEMFERTLRGSKMHF